MLVNRAGLADILSCSINTVTNYQKEGMPIEESPHERGGKEYSIDTGKAIKWIIRYKCGDKKEDGSLAGAKARHEAASAELKEYALAEKRGVMISLDDVAAEVSTVFHLVRVRLRSIPIRPAQVLSVESSPVEVERIIKLEIDGALSELSSYEDSRDSPR